MKHTPPTHRHANRAEAAAHLADQNEALFPDRNAPAKPIVARHAEQLPAPIAPYSSIVEMPCDDCGGDGADRGTLREYEPCEVCGGSGKQAALRNWLGEAFQIESGQLDMNPEREHLIALRHYATEFVTALNNREAA